VLFRVLGPMQVEGPSDEPVEAGADVQQRLLAVLLIRANMWVEAETLNAVLWPDGAPASAKSKIKTYVYHLRQLLPRVADGSPRINSRSGGYRLNVRRPELDAAVFEDLILRAQSTKDKATAAELFRRALELWRGEPYGPLRFELGEFADAEVTRLTELLWVARYGLADALNALCKHDEVVALLRPLVEEDPQREPTWERLVATLYTEGRRDDALDAFHEARRALGTDPGLGLRRLHECIVAEDDPAADETQQIVTPRSVPEDSPLEQTTGAAPSNVRYPPADDPQPWKEWRVQRPTRRRRRTVGVLIGLAVLAAVALLGIAAIALRDGRLFGTSDQAIPPTAETTGSQPLSVSPRRAIPGQPAADAADRPVVLFGIGDRVDTARETALDRDIPARMLTTWNNGSEDLARYAGWRETVLARAYADGFAQHLVLADRSEPRPVDTKLGPACGRPYSLSEQFLADAVSLAETFAGTADSPPLFVSVFDGVQDFACTRGAILPDEQTTVYYRALLGQYFAVREIFHQLAPNALVSLSWDSAMAGHDEPAIGGGASMFVHFADAMRLSDFISISAVDSDNADHVRAAVQALGRYGPVMLAYYHPSPPKAMDSDVHALLADEFLADATRDGLFAVSFGDDGVLDAAPRVSEFVVDVMRRHARPAR
jgi:DNA-binding SARP family transcriptional activator